MFSGLKIEPHGGGKKALETARLSLLSLVGQLNANRRRRIIVVFDNKTAKDSPNIRPPFPNMEVCFSNPRSSADDKIRQLVEESRQPTAIQVVTSDKTIRKNVENLGAKTISCEEFAGRLRTAVPSAKKATPAEPPAKHSGISGAEADKWLKMFNMAEEE
jgi:predicted RNA-binding protein with PIN domain